MKIAICASLDFTTKIDRVRKELKEKEHKVIIPKTSQMILKGEVSLEEIKKEKREGEVWRRAQRLDVLKYYFQKIKESDAILVLNYDKEGIKNYIGGNTFLEMGFAYVLDKEIYVLNKLPEVPYLDEIKTMNPIILKGDLSYISTKKTNK